MNSFSGAVAYKQVDRFSAIEGASPHQLVTMLMQGAIDRMAVAKGLMERSDFAGKGLIIGKTISIMTELKTNLNLKDGGELAANLNGIYEYIMHIMLQANLNNDPKTLDEASSLLSGILESWNSIPLEQRNKGQ
jgi:flagellar protein FliS